MLCDHSFMVNFGLKAEFFGILVHFERFCKKNPPNLTLTQGFKNLLT